MKKLLLSTAAIMLAAPALAADLPRRSPAVAPAPVFTQAFSWQGFYVGAQVGYAWGTADTVGSFGGVIPPGGNVGVETQGFIGGVHAGYNLQSGSFVYGIEADVEFADVKESGTILGATFIGKNDLRGSLRARFGFAFDRALIYVTGGLAAGRVEASAALAAARDSNSETRFGWTVGAGVEYALSSNWSARLEYRYTDLGDMRLTLTNLVANTSFTESAIKDHSVRVGLSYRFGGPARPVVARY